MKQQKLSDAAVVFLLAFLIRIAGIILTTFGLNPDQGTDTSGFAHAAEAIASGTMPLSEVLRSLGASYPTWGLFLSPFWLLPGPSELYAQVFMALLGAFAIYNIYCLVSYCHSKQAAVFAVVPLMILPSFVALHSIILRDVAILAGITYAIRLLIVPGRWRTSIRYALALLAITIASILRLENLPLYAVMFGTGVMLTYLPREYYATGGTIAGVLAVVSYPVTERVFRWLGLLGGRDHLVDFLLFMRRARISEGGRTQYLTDISLQTPTDVLLYAPLGAIYFLFVPFPWMAETVIDYITVVESLVMLVFAVAALRGMVLLARRDLPLLVALLLGTCLFALLYGIISVNVGTSVRQRQTFSWILFALGGIAIAQSYRLDIVWSYRNTHSNAK